MATPNYILAHVLKNAATTAMKNGIPVEDVIATLAQLQDVLSDPMYRAALNIIKTTEEQLA